MSKALVIAAGMYTHATHTEIASFCTTEASFKLMILFSLSPKY